MPYHVKSRGSKWVVIGDDGHVFGTHPTKVLAREQQKALYVNAPESNMERLVSLLTEARLRQELTDRLDPLVEHLPPELVSDIKRLLEAMDTGDWAKMGLVFGALWYKLDRIIAALEQQIRSGSGIERNTAQCASALAQLLQRR
jgi:hypothetical protein